MKVLLPAAVRAVFDALRFRDARFDALASLNDREWQALLPFCDDSQLTLPLATACTEPAREVLPAWVAARFQSSLSQTRVRAEIVARNYAEIAAELQRGGLSFVVLKGFAGAPEFVPDPACRVQYDLDLFLQRDAVMQAPALLRNLGYEPLEKMAEFPTDHLPVMVRKTGWQWRGDYFDPEIPVSVDLHFRLWNEELEQFPAPGWEEFWERRIEKSWLGLNVPAFSIPDALGYHCLHLIRHLLRGNLRLSHVHELGRFLHRFAGNDAFWETWRSLHPAPLRRLQAIAFAVARDWFACSLSRAAAEEIARLPESATAWLKRYSYAPAASAWKTNKHELWLHMELLDSWSKRRRILQRRLLPAPRRGTSGAAFLPPDQLTWQIRAKHALRLWLHRARRARRHVSVLPSAVVHGSAWLLRTILAGKRQESGLDSARS